MTRYSWRDVQLGEVLFEFAKVGTGRLVRVSAIDPKTNTEVVMAGDPRYGQEMLKRMAMRKLAYVIAKKRNEGTLG